MMMADTAEVSGNDGLGRASFDRLACLFRHWTWASEAKARFEHELAGGVALDEKGFIKAGPD